MLKLLDILRFIMASVIIFVFGVAVWASVKVVDPAMEKLNLKL